MHGPDQLAARENDQEQEEGGQAGMRRLEEAHRHVVNFNHCEQLIQMA